MGTIDFAPLWITLKTGIVASVFSFFIGIAFAELVINTKGRVRAFWDGLLTLPMVLPPTVAGYILLRIFSTRRPLGSFLSNSMGIQVVHTWLGCVVAATIIALPLMYRNARAAFVRGRLRHAGQYFIPLWYSQPQRCRQRLCFYQR